MCPFKGHQQTFPGPRSGSCKQQGWLVAEAQSAGPRFITAQFYTSVFSKNSTNWFKLKSSAVSIWEMLLYWAQMELCHELEDSALYTHLLEGEVGGFREGRCSALGRMACSMGVSRCPSGLSEYWNWTVPDSTCFTYNRPQDWWRPRSLHQHPSVRTTQPGTILPALRWSMRIRTPGDHHHKNTLTQAEITTLLLQFRMRFLINLCYVDCFPFGV